MIRLLLILPILSAFVLQANAKEIAKQDQWILEELESGGEILCVASTKDNGFFRDYFLKVQKVKDSDMPVEIFILEDGRQKFDELAHTYLDSELVLFNRISINDKMQEFWYLPDETKKLIDTLKTSNNIKFRPLGDLDGKKIKFSLDGSSAILTKMEDHCNGGFELVDQDFAELTNHPEQFDQNPRIFNLDQIASIRAVYYELADVQKLLKIEEANLDALVARYRPQITERDKLSNEQAEIINQTIPQLKQDIQKTTKRIAASEERLRQLVIEIPAAKKQKDLKQVKRDKAYQEIAPHMPRHNKLVRDLNQSRSNLRDTENNLATSRSELRSNEREIQNLNRRVDRLESEIWSLKSDISSAERVERQARRDYERFDARREIDSRLRSSSRYQSARRDAQRYEQQVNTLQRELNSLERDLSRSKQQLRRCQADPDKDCAREKALVDRYVTRVRDSRRRLNSAKRSQQSAERQANSIRDDIERDVKREERKLRDDYEEARSRLNRLEARLKSAENEKYNIVRREIPRLENRNSDLRRYIMDLEQHERTLREEVRLRKNELDAFKTSVGYDRLERNLNQAESELRYASNVYKSLVNEQKRLRVQVPEDKALLVELNKALQENETRLVVIANRLSQLEKELEQFDKEKAVIEAKMADIDKQTQVVKEKYMTYFK